LEKFDSFSDWAFVIIKEFVIHWGSLLFEVREASMIYSIFVKIKLFKLKNRVKNFILNRANLTP